jgi:hypothetical protein
LSAIVVAGDTSGSVTLSAPAIAGSVVITLPTTSGTMTAFASGTVMLFVQTAAPTGWTKSVANNDKALRVVSGAASTGGSVAFTTAFASGLSSSGYTLATADIPSHNHSFVQYQATGGGNSSAAAAAVNSVTTTVNSTGGGGSHAHTLPSFAVSYVDTIIATKD